MQTLFTATFFSENRRRLREQLASDAPIVIAANGLLQRTADTTFPFQQESNFWYLTGLNEPDLILVMDDTHEYILVPGRSTSREAFDGAVDRDALSRISGVAEILSEEDGWKRLGDRLKKAGSTHTLLAPPSYIESHGIYTNPARGRCIERMKTWATELELDDIRGKLISMRSIKQPEELRAIQLAIDTTIAGIKQVTHQDSLTTFEYEFAIENALTTAFRTEQASGHAFTPIIASGKRACTLHNESNSGKLQDGELVVIDVGAEVSHYAADISRTVAIGDPSERQQQVFDAVLDVQAFALKQLKPGTDLKAYETEVEHYMGSKLVELGLITEINRENVRHYYPHATSHFMGLDVHDVGDYSQPLAAGMVLTCEPGIYIPEEGIGVRIEDDVLITDTGHTVLSDALPRVLRTKS